MSKTYANLLISREVYNLFRLTCDRLGMKYNAQVEMMMKKFNEENGEIGKCRVKEKHP